jgi:hypothetical protein
MICLYLNTNKILDESQTDAEQILDTSDCCLMPSVEISNFQLYHGKIKLFFDEMYTQLRHSAGFFTNFSFLRQLLKNILHERDYINLSS